MDLSGWQLSDGVRYTFGAVQMAPGQTVVVAGDREALLSLYPELDPALVVGNWEGALSNGGRTSGWKRRMERWWSRFDTTMRPRGPLVQMPLGCSETGCQPQCCRWRTILEKVAPCSG